MKVFPDTNIWISAFLTSGTVSDLIEVCLSRHTVQTSGWVIKEVERILTKKYRALHLPVNEILDFLSDETEIVSESRLERPICRDPDDDHILAAAKAGNADCIISGDQDLLVLKSYEGIPIVSPRQFWQFEASRRNE